MGKLLRANFSRLRHDRSFIVLTALMVAFGVILPFMHYIDTVHSGVPWMLDYSLFTYAFLAPILLSVLSAMFVGNEYSNGTLRNKIIAGNRRSSIYLANLIVCGFSGILLCVAFMVTHIGFGLLLSGKFGSDLKTVVSYIGLSFALTIAFSALFTLVAMLCRSKAHTAASCVLLVFILIFLGIYITSSLNEPEYLPGYSYTENGVTVEEPETKNPNYVSGTKREVYEFLQDFTSGGQALQLADMEVENTARLAIYDGVILLIFTACGMIVFRRKDLN